jgi:L-aminopeptidase/D-esterase-like protein
VVGAIIAVNAIGDVIDPEQGKIVAGVRPLHKGTLKISGESPFTNSLDIMKTMIGRTLFSLSEKANTVIGVVATNAGFDKAATTKMAQMAQNGVVRCIRPAHTMHDGDTIFGLALGRKKANINIVGAYAAQAVQLAILNAIYQASSLGGIPAATDLTTE